MVSLAALIVFMAYSAVIGTARTRWFALALGGVLVAASCSASSEESGVGVESATVSTEMETSTSTSSSVTTSTVEPTVTTLSELELARAEVTGVVEAWFHFRIDSSDGQDGLGVQFLTGAMRARSLEVLQRLELAGQVQVRRRPQPLEITSVDIDLETGFAQVAACFGAANELLDAETLEVISADDPSYTTTSTFELQVIDSGDWKISEWRLSRNSDNPIECEVTS
jgi:hypothetical protein